VGTVPREGYQGGYFLYPKCQIPKARWFSIGFFKKKLGGHGPFGIKCGAGILPNGQNFETM